MITMENKLPQTSTDIPTLNELGMGDIFETLDNDIGMKISDEQFNNILLWYKTPSNKGDWVVESMPINTLVYPIDYTITLNKRKV